MEQEIDLNMVERLEKTEFSLEGRSSIMIVYSTVALGYFKKREVVFAAPLGLYICRESLTGPTYFRVKSTHPNSSPDDIGVFVQSFNKTRIGKRVFVGTNWAFLRTSVDFPRIEFEVASTRLIKLEEKPWGSVKQSLFDLRTSTARHLPL